MASQDPKQTPNNNKISENNNNHNSMLSPRFKAVAEMAGWDEESLLLASLIVEDTPERLNKRSDLSHKSPLNNNSSRRKRRRPRPGSVPIPVLNLDDDESFTATKHKDAEKGKSDLPKKVEETDNEKEKVQEKSDDCSSSAAFACMDRLRDELSCAICLEICYEPSTTPCGHSFCKNCLKSAADKCGKRCPKCRQLISNGRSCTINTVLWNTIQLIFPQEVEARRAAAAAALNNRVAERRKESPETRISSNNHATNSNLNVSRRLRQPRRVEEARLSSRRGVPDQDEDAALALRLQREEFMGIYRGSSLARDNLRAMARRAMNVTRNRDV